MAEFIVSQDDMDLILVAARFLAAQVFQSEITEEMADTSDRLSRALSIMGDRLAEAS